MYFYVSPQARMSRPRMHEVPLREIRRPEARGRTHVEVALSSPTSSLNTNILPPSTEKDPLKLSSRRPIFRRRESLRYRGAHKADGDLHISWKFHMR